MLQYIPTLASASIDSSNSDTELTLEYQANAALNNAVQLEILKLAVVPRCRLAKKTPDNKYLPLRTDTSKYY